MPSDELPRPVPRAAARARDWLEWFGVGRLVTVALSLLAVGAGGWWLLRAPATPVEDRLPLTSAATTTTTIATGAGAGSAATAPVPTGSVPPVEVVVHVAGAVVGPGVYRLAPGARVVDAIAAAGGLAPDADPDAVNQAEAVLDGERVYVPRAGEVVSVPVGVSGGAAPPPASGTVAPAGPVDLNTADVAALDALPGVGPATAAAIVAYRDEHGPFASVDDLAEVRGIGPAKLDALRGLVTT